MASQNTLLSIHRNSSQLSSLQKKGMRWSATDAPPAGGPKTRLTVRQLAVSPNFARDLAGTGGSRPEIGAGPDAALPHLDHHGHLRANRANRPAPSLAATLGVCQWRDRASGTRDRCHGLRFLGRAPRKKARKWTYVPIHVPKRSKSTDFRPMTHGAKTRQVIEKIGGASRARTDDLIVANDALSQLSYSPILWWVA